MMSEDYNDSSSEEGGVPEVVGGTGLTVHPPHSIGASDILLDTNTSANNPNTITDTHLHSDDESGNILDRDYTGMFEGPEKTLEVVFRRIDGNVTDVNTGRISPVDPSEQQENSSAASTASATTEGSHGCNTLPVTPGSIISIPGGSEENFERKGLRQLLRPDLDLICSRARCTIISHVSNRYLDAYVLSESSLFVYPYMLVLKTCGTTTLLRCIAVLIDLARKLGLEIDWVGYSRKNFNFPGDQAFPHQSFHQELDYLYSHRKLSERLQGNGYTLGPVTGDHWFVFVADHTKRVLSPELDTDRVLNIMMFDIDEDAAKMFYYDQYDQNIEGETKEEELRRISEEMTMQSGIKDLCPGAIIDPRAFEPCGYSMNAILFHSYSTIHITPEAGSSYASFETNQKVGSYKALISNVIRTFRPKRFVITLMADECGLQQVKDNPVASRAADAQIVVPATRAPKTSADAVPVRRQSVPLSKHSFVYKRNSVASIKVEEDCCCMMGTWAMDQTSSAVALRANKQRGMSMS